MQAEPSRHDDATAQQRSRRTSEFAEQLGFRAPRIGRMAAKPLVLYEADDMVALASEEIAIREIIYHEIDTYDPYEGEVMVWQR